MYLENNILLKQTDMGLKQALDYTYYNLKVLVSPFMILTLVTGASHVSLIASLY